MEIRNSVTFSEAVTFPRKGTPVEYRINVTVTQKDRLSQGGVINIGLLQPQLYVDDLSMSDIKLLYDTTMKMVEAAKKTKLARTPEGI